MALCTILLPEPRSSWTRHFPAEATPLQLHLVEHTFQSDPLDVRFADGIGHGRCHLRVWLEEDGLSVASRTKAILKATELACALVDDGALGVVIHQAGEVLFSARAWAHRTQRLGQPEWMPVLAWMDLGNRDGVVLSHGLRAFGLPEVAVVREALGRLDDDEAWDRSQEAVLAAASTMVARAAPLANGEQLQVTAGTEFSGSPPQFDNLGLDEPLADVFGVWTAARLEHVIRLEPLPMPPLAERFAMLQAVGTTPYPTYRRLFLDRLACLGYQKVAFVWPRQIPEVPAHEVIVLEHAERRRFLVTTCGLGRVPQRGGTPENENQFMEFALDLPTHSPQIAQTLAVLSWMSHLKDPDSQPIGPFHRSAVFGVPYPYPWVVYDRLPDLNLGAEVPVTLLQPLFMSAEEREATPIGHIAEWIEQHRTEALRRWLPVTG